MMSRFLAIALLALGLSVAGIGPAVSDLVITLKDGRVVRVPVDADQVQSLSFEDPDKDAGKAAEAPAAAQPAETGTAAPAVAEGDLAALVVPVPPESRKLDTAPIQVGPTRKYKVPSQAAKMARDGAVIEIDAGTYSGDVAVWPQSNLTIRGVGGLAHMAAGGNAAGGKAIWVFRGDNVTVESVELSDCHVPDLNGAGIRFEGANLTIRNSYVHDNQMGLLTNRNAKSDILIEYSEFADNIVDYEATGSLGHNIYVSEVRNFTLRGSYVHGASYGHNVKTRAAHNYIMYNRLMDGDGNSSYLIDLAEGGDAYVIGNVMQQSKITDNWTMVAYATEGGKNDLDADIYVVNNTAVSDAPEGIFVRNQGSAVANVFNNVFTGGQTLVEGPANAQGNVVGADVGLADRAGYDYHLVQGSPAIDAGVVAGTGAGQSALPRMEYREPRSLMERPRHGPIDAGAYEADAP
jgi:hypothetical protein